VVDSRNTKLLLVGLITFLCAQFGVAYYWNEPYPAVIMPGFTYSPPTAGKTTVRGYRVVATGPSGSAFVLDADKFFNGVPHWYVLTDVSFVLDSTPPAPSGWPHLRARFVHRAKVRSDAGSSAFVTYAQRRLAELTSRNDWDSLRIEETSRDLDLDQMSYVGSARVDRSREFRLK
jgi:hypothetical protein